MDIRSWCKRNSGCSDGEAAHLGRSPRRGGSGSMSSSAASTPLPLPAPPPGGRGSSLAKQRWRELWTKLTKEKGRMTSAAAGEALVPYDFYNYSQNFDQGIAWDEPENVSRSFSVRFADPDSRAKKRASK
ncbi:hypothetical protein BT93_C0623 [Corymbia citriodora subsp. variegata]|nr:hypothetical protein BT93_C0623 [Corymbia citriodora subsp. variegata]